MAASPHSPTSSQVAEFVKHGSKAIDLVIQPEHLPGVLENTVRLHTIARLFLEFRLPDDVEDAGVFQP